MKTTGMRFKLITLLITGILLFFTGNAIAEETEPPAAQPAAEQNRNNDTGKTNGKRYVSIDFNNVDISVFVKFMSELTGKNFVIDQRVRGKVTIISPAKISVDEAYQVFNSVLEVNGFATVPAGNLVKIIPSPDARTKSIETRIKASALSEDDRMVTQIIPLKYADPAEIKRLLTPMISKSSVILDYTPTNMLIVTDAESNIKRLMRIIETIDVTGVGQKISVIQIEYSDASKLVKTIGSIFQSSTRPAKGAQAPNLTMVADERTNTIVMRASEEETYRVKQLVSMLDKETPRGKGNINVYYLEHGTAEELAQVLQEIPQKGTEGGAPGKKTAPVVSDKVRITADKATNSLIIMADKEDYEVIKDIIRKIDIPRSMVYIEALFVEVNASRSLDLGTEWLVGEDFEVRGREAVGGGGFRGTGTSLSGVNTTTGVIGFSNPGMSLGVFGEAIDIGGLKFPSLTAVANAFQGDSDINILSTPQISVLDNEEAKIIVGDTIPFKTKATTTGSSDTFNSYEYKAVGKDLKITPHISKDRIVRLAIELNVSEVKPDADPETPSTFTREVKTTVVVRDKHTLVIGGLIEENDNRGSSQVPCLGDVPLLGWGFKRSFSNDRKTNLYIFITPHVILNPQEADILSSQKKDIMDKLNDTEIQLYKGEDTVEEPIQIPTNQKYEYKEPADNGKDDQSSLENQEAAVSSAALAQPTTEATVSYEHSTQYTLQVASYRSREKADDKLRELNGMGHSAYMIQSEVNDTVWYRVRVGYFDSREDALEMSAQMKKQHIPTILVEQSGGGQ